MFAKKYIMGIMVEHRQETAAAVQEILTQYGCFIKTRLGLHQTAEDACSERGLILLEFDDHAGKEVTEIKNALTAVSGVEIRMMEF